MVFASAVRFYFRVQLVGGKADEVWFLCSLEGRRLAAGVQKFRGFAAWILKN